MEYRKIFTSKSQSIGKSPYAQILLSELTHNTHKFTPILSTNNSRNTQSVPFSTQCVPRELLPLRWKRASPEYCQSPAFSQLHQHILMQRNLIKKLTKDLGKLKHKIYEKSPIFRESKRLNPLRLPIKHGLTNDDWKSQIISMPKIKPSKVNIEFQCPVLMRICVTKKKSRALITIHKKASKKCVLQSLTNHEQSIRMQSNAGKSRDYTADDIKYEDSRAVSNHSPLFDTVEHEKSPPKRRVIYIRARNRRIENELQ